MRVDHLKERRPHDPDAPLTLEELAEMRSRYKDCPPILRQVDEALTRRFLRPGTSPIL
jgi:hypothetical protein